MKRFIISLLVMFVTAGQVHSAQRQQELLRQDWLVSLARQGQLTAEAVEAVDEHAFRVLRCNATNPFNTSSLLYADSHHQDAVKAVSNLHEGILARNCEIFSALTENGTLTSQLVQVLLNAAPNAAPLDMVTSAFVR